MARPRKSSSEQALAEVGYGNWNKFLGYWFDTELPDSYIAIDTETSGFSHEKDVPVDVGFTLVIDRKIVDKRSMLVDWSQMPGFDLEALQSKFDTIAMNMAKRNSVWRYSVSYLRKHGTNPYLVFEVLHKLLKKAEERDYMLVGQNVLSFDFAMISHVFSRLGMPWRCDPARVLDTGVLEKVSRCYAQFLSPTQWLEPTPGESLSAFLRRAQYANKPGVKWNIESCVQRYALCDRFGLCEENLHGAMADSYVCTLMLEDHRNGTNPISLEAIHA